MAALEEEGYISRPHLSAGGVPTDKAYRYYVEALATTHELPLETKRSMQREFTSVGRDVDEWTKLSARMLAEVASNMALVSMPRTIQTRIRNLQLVYLDEHLVMQVVVLQEARLRKELVPLAEPVSEEDINHVAGKLNNHVKGLSYQEVLDRSIETTPLEKDVLDVALRILQEEDQASFADYIIEGLRHLVDQPEFKGSSQVHDLIEILESRRLAQAILTESPGVGGIRVVIGSENHEDALKPMSLVIAQYGVRNQVFGTISIVGPMRMHYERTIAGVNYFSSLMSQMLEEVGLGPS
jgi:heat-inducible transcriptional repressor